MRSASVRTSSAVTVVPRCSDRTEAVRARQAPPPNFPGEEVGRTVASAASGGLAVAGGLDLAGASKMTAVILCASVCDRSSL
eukprot:7387196-Prymnesium_polylepis.1